MQSKVGHSQENAPLGSKIVPMSRDSRSEQCLWVKILSVIYSVPKLFIPIISSLINRFSSRVSENSPHKKTGRLRPVIHEATYNESED